MKSPFSLKSSALIKFLLKSVQIPKLHLQKTLKLTRQELNDQLLVVENRMRLMGLKVHGEERVFVTRYYSRRQENIVEIQESVESEQNGIVEKENKIRKNLEIPEKRQKHSLTHENVTDVTDETDQGVTEVDYSLPREYFIIFSIIFLESGILLLDRLTNFLNQIDCLKELQVDSLINKMKRENYLRVFKEEEILMVEFCWRFHLEMPGFNPTQAIEMFCLTDSL